MEDGITVTMPGVRDLIADLKQFDEKIRYRVVRKSIRDIGNFVADRLRAAAPVFTGRLQENIGVTTRFKSRSGIMQAKVRISTRGKADDPKNSFYWRIITREGGFRPRGGATVVPQNDFIQKTEREVRQRVAQMFFRELERSIDRRSR